MITTKGGRSAVYDLSPQLLDHLLAADRIYHIALSAPRCLFEVDVLRKVESEENPISPNITFELVIRNHSLDSFVRFVA